MPSSTAIAIATGTARLNAAPATPARMNARMISSVAYADDEIASELKIASAFVLDRRWPISSSFARGRPSRAPLTRKRKAPRVVVGALAAALAVSWPGPVYRK